MSLSSSINLVAKVQIFIKILMYVLSHGCLLSSYKVFFHLHTWFCLSCVSTPTGCKCLFESCFVSHDVSIYGMMEIWTSLQYWYCSLDIILLELVFPFFLEGSALMMSLHLSYYFSSWTVITCYSEQVSSFFSCRRLCMRYFLQFKCIYMVRDIS